MVSPVNELFRNTRLKISDGRFVFVGLSNEKGRQDIVDLGLRLGGDIPFMIFQDGLESTFLLPEKDWKAAAFSIPEVRVESGFRLVTIDRELTWDVVGFLARVTRVLAEAGISVGVLSSFSRDHLLIKDSELDKAQSVLSELFQV